MLLLALNSLTARKGGAFGAFAAVALAVALVVSCGVLLESSLAARGSVDRLGATPVVVQGDPSTGGKNYSVLLSERRRLPERMAGTIARVPGVAQVVADRSFYAQVFDGRGRPLLGADGGPSAGHGWASAALTPSTLTAGHAPLAPDEIVVDSWIAAHASLRPGDRVEIVTATSARSFVVAGISVAPRQSAAAVFFRDDVARRLSGAGSRVDLFGVITRPGADPGRVAELLRAQLPAGARVLTGTNRSDAESPEGAVSREDVVVGLTFFALLAGFIAVFVVAGTFALSVQQRHRELALFRAIGGTPRQMQRMVAAEALIVSLAAFALAAPAGLLLAHVERGLFAHADMVPSDLAVRAGWLPFAAGLAVAVLTTQLAAFASGRRASRIRPTDALREASVQRRPVSWLRGLTGLAALAAGVGVLFFILGGGSSGQSDAPAATMILMVAAALLGPLLALPFAWLLGLPLAALSRGPGMLARANTRANLRRVASVATPVMLAVSLICTILFAKSAYQQETTAQTAHRTTAEYVIRADDAPGIPHGVTAAVARVPGVAVASGTLATTAIVKADGVNPSAVEARGVDASSLVGVLDLDVRSGSLADLHGAALAVGADDAKSFGWKVGDRVQIVLGDGTPVRLKVVATFARPLGFGEIVLPRSLAVRHVTDPLDDAVFVKAAPGTDPDALFGRLSAIERANPTVHVLTRSGLEHELQAAARHQSLGVYVLLAVIAAFCALALVNALAMATAERGREFALLRLVGASKGQVRSMVRAETVIMVVFGLAVGSLVAVPGLAGVNHSLTGSALPAVSLKAYGAIVAGYAVLAFAACILPTRIALRLNPVTAMAARQ